MPMVLPPFPENDYGFIKPDLKGPFAMLERVNLEQEIEGLSKEYSSNARRGAVGEDLLTTLMEDLLRFRKGFPADRAESLKWSLERYRKHIKSGVRPMANEELVNIALLYGSIDTELLANEFRQAFADELSGEESGNQDRLAAKIKKLKDQLSETWGEMDVTQFFVSVPQVWRNLTRKTAKSDNEYCENILRQFLKDFRARAACFQPACTVNGVMIASLPSSSRRLWEKLWKAMDLDNVRRSPRWMFKKAPVTEKVRRGAFTGRPPAKSKG